MIINQNAREYLDYYLDLPGDAEFAVLLEGPWGSGKTHFVETYFADRFAEARKADPDVKDPLIHVTLFGVRELADITTQMFEKAHPVLGGTAVKLINNVGSRIGGLFGLGLDPKENAEALQAMVLNLKGRVLVFDDLERSPLPMVEVMGFINGFVEHNKLKVIVVASEDDIPKRQKEEYKRRKEKLVGKTIKVGSDPSEVLDVFMKRLRTRQVIEAVSDNRAALLTTFSASGRPNFRSLRAVLLDYERLVTLVDPILRSSKQAMGRLLLCMVALGVEFRSNEIDGDGLRTLQFDIRRRLHLGTTARTDTVAQKRAAALRERYEQVNFDDPIVPTAELADLFTSGAVDIVAVNRHIEKHPTVVGFAEVPAWRFMWSWHDHPASVYSAARVRFLDDLTRRRLTHPGQILHAAGSAIRLKKYGDNLFGAVSARTYFKKYLADVDTAGTLEAAPDLFDGLGGSYAGLVYNEDDTSEFAAIKALVKASAQRALERYLRAAAPDLLARLGSHRDATDSLYEWGLEKRNFGGFALLQYIPVADFADIALVDGKPNDKLLASLGERYKRRPNDELEAEYSWIEKLRAELKLRVSGLSPPYEDFAKLRIDYAFVEVDKVVSAYRARKKIVRKPRATKTGPATTATAAANKKSP